MGFDQIQTAIAFIVIVAIGVGVLLTMPMGMGTDTVLTMVLPSMVVFGLLILGIGIKHGEYRARN